MENKKLLRILENDMTELEELISEIKGQGNFDVMEMEFVHTKAKGVMQLVRLLNNPENKNGKNEITLKSEKIEQLKETVSEIDEEVEKLEDSEMAENNVKENIQTEPVSEKIPDNPDDKFQDETEPESVEESEISNEPESNKINEQSESEDNDDVMLEEEEQTKPPGSTIGDSFLKGKSINDILTDQNKLEFKLSNRPVESIKTAIGINDRFQYIRELFGGNSEKFINAVQILDSKQNIKQAVEYLRHNYKWKKSETSLKFVNLVKRRFQNE